MRYSMFIVQWLLLNPYYGYYFIGYLYAPTMNDIQLQLSINLHATYYIITLAVQWL